MPAGGGAAFPSAASARLRALVGPSHPEAQSLRGEPAGADSFEALAFKARRAPHTRPVPGPAVKAHALLARLTADDRTGLRCVTRVLDPNCDSASRAPQVQALGSATSTDASPFAQRLAGSSSTQRPSIELTNSGGPDSSASPAGSAAGGGAGAGGSSSGYPPAPPSASPFTKGPEGGAGGAGGERHAGGAGRGAAPGGVSPDVMRALGFKGSSAH